MCDFVSLFGCMGALRIGKSVGHRSCIRITKEKMGVLTGGAGNIKRSRRTDEEKSFVGYGPWESFSYLLLLGFAGPGCLDQTLPSWDSAWITYQDFLEGWLLVFLLLRRTYTRLPLAGGLQLDILFSLGVSFAGMVG